eukprot:CAMPEP_0115149708 /NCGR_PEP_ID=MMETSP0227-20121206/64617_1 /TAXON_ID=89957 /ORGANISM="Polarella glacialis, Strain CCMP 1383" /LENGTH=39 /DNA_ID= /DNA_START= /DNA_END= /DNA_ORIENTATION=
MSTMSDLTSKSSSVGAVEVSAVKMPATKALLASQPTESP